MIKKFEEYINEDYFSKLANRKDTGIKRKENQYDMFVDLGLPSGTLWMKEPYLCDENIIGFPEMNYDIAFECCNSIDALLPTKGLFEELITNCKREKINGYNNGINKNDACKFIGPNGNEIVVEYGNYWTCSSEGKKFGNDMVSVFFNHSTGYGYNTGYEKYKYAKESYNRLLPVKIKK